jgi:hypothetical protein
MCAKSKVLIYPTHIVLPSPRSLYKGRDSALNQFRCNFRELRLFPLSHFPTPASSDILHQPRPWRPLPGATAAATAEVMEATSAWDGTGIQLILEGWVIWVLVLGLGGFWVGARARAVLVVWFDRGSGVGYLFPGGLCVWFWSSQFVAACMSASRVVRRVKFGS